MDSEDDKLKGDNRAYKPVENEEGTDLENGNNSDGEDLDGIRKQLRYPIGRDPNWALSFLLGLQQYLVMWGSTFGISVVLAPGLCVDSNVAVKGQLLNTMFTMCGITTLLQVMFGTRLPIIQSGSWIFFPVAAGILSDTTCKEEYHVLDDDGNNVTQSWDPNWHSGMAKLQGNLMLASLAQMILGGFGLVGLLLKVVGPITISVMISLIGLNLANVAKYQASKNWGIALLMVVFVTLLSEYFKNIAVPLPYISFSRQEGTKFGVKWVKLFSTLSVIISLVLVWVLCGILTATDTLGRDNPARVGDIRKSMGDATWFYFPYPGQFGTPQVSVGGFVGFLAAILAGAIESIGDYFACAKLAGAPPPPKYALNRGILLEGVGCFLAGACGPGLGVTSYSENIGAIGLTKVGSRRVICCSAILMILMGVIGKIGVLFASIPAPIIGGMYMVMFGIVTAVGISNLRFIDLTCSRNVFIVGISIYFGVVVPMWISDPSSAAAIATGNSEFDQLVRVLFSSGMIVGAAIACFLDNTIAGTDKKRGLLSYEFAATSSSDRALIKDVYYEPLMEFLARKIPVLRKLPFVPSSA
ncbi:hypothetical protein ACHWQZ_G018778 [Mnemiopsis leidyi]